MTRIGLQNIILKLVLGIILITSGLPLSTLVNAQQLPLVEQKIYLPIIFNRYHHGFSTEEKFIGIFMKYTWNNQTVGNINTANNLANKKHAVIGWSIGLQNHAFTSQARSDLSNNFYGQLETLWINGYISFINISSEQQHEWTSDQNCPYNATAKQIADGFCDRAIRKMAELYNYWLSQGDGRKAFIAPFPEMNGVDSYGKPWTSYGGDKDNFILAYKRMQAIFIENGISRNQIWWVFAPNGWHDRITQPHHAFEFYYPGDEIVDVVGFSSYNFGYCCVANPWNSWDNYEEIFEPYIHRFNQLAPHKPIIIAQTGVTAEDFNDPDRYVNEKNAWLNTNYSWLVSQPSILGVIYFDINADCKWSITSEGSTFSSGYRDGARNFKVPTIQDFNMILGD